VAAVGVVHVPRLKTNEPVSPGFTFAELQAAPSQAGSVASAVLVTEVVTPNGAAITNTMSKTGLLPSNGPLVTLAS
jgi:hypothetical protein